MKFQKISFQNSAGESLSGRIDFPLIKKPKAYVLFAHCFTCSKNLKPVEHICHAFNSLGMAILRFDFTGLGQSEGDFAATNFSSNLSDLHDAYDYLANHFEAPQIIVGHSLGGAAVLHISAHLKNVKAVATIGAPSTPKHVMHLLNASQEELVAKGEAEINIGGRLFKMKKQFLDDLESKDDFEEIKHLKKALLILHSPQDKIVGIENAQEIYLNAMHPKSFVSLAGADHLLTSSEDAQYAGMMIANWANRYIALNQTEEAPEGEIWTRLGENTYTTEVIAGRHRLIADEPVGLGGKDMGPTPYGYLLAALGTCTAMTLRMYADHKKLKLEEVEVRLTHDKIHKIDGQNDKSAPGKIDRIKIHVKLRGDLSEAQRTRLLEMAKRCPVHRTIKSAPEMIISEIGELAGGAIR